MLVPGVPVESRLPLCLVLMIFFEYCCCGEAVSSLLPSVAGMSSAHSWCRMHLLSLFFTDSDYELFFACSTAGATKCPWGAVNKWQLGTRHLVFMTCHSCLTFSSLDHAVSVVLILCGSPEKKMRVSSTLVGSVATYLNNNKINVLSTRLQQ